MAAGVHSKRSARTGRRAKPGRARRRRARAARGRPLQLSLAARGRGGWRPNAGRKPTGTNSVPHRRRPRLASRHPVHVTLRVCPDVPPLRRGKLRRLVVKAFADARRPGARTRRTPGRRARNRRRTAARPRPTFRLCHYSIQNDHLHLICEAAGAEHLARGMQGLAVRLARRLNRAIGRRGAVWAERYHGRPLRSPKEVRNALVYVLQNGRHHAMGPDQGPVPPGCLDACSSAAYFDGWKERVRFAPATDPPQAPVSPPHTWLLSKGWKRHGRVSVHEGPAH